MLVILVIGLALFGIKGQNIAYFLYDNLPILEAQIYLVITTVCTLVLYIAASILSYKIMRKSVLWNGRYYFLFSFIVVMGGVISLMSLLILVTWLG